MKILVTGSSGLIGSELVLYYANQNCKILGVDNNMRAIFFGAQGDNRWMLKRLRAKCSNFTHIDLDIRDRQNIMRCIKDFLPDLIVNAAGQPSHDYASSHVFEDFDINAAGALNLLEAARQYVPNAVFVHISSNKVYGDSPNKIRIKELPTRWDYDDPLYSEGISEDFCIDRSKHSIFGASKLSADIMVQEYGRYFGMKTCSLRAGCVTGANHSGVEMHGYLSYLVRMNLQGGVYKIYGYKGKQVRDNIHALDVVRFICEFYKKPRCAEVYNIGGGRNNSCSILEAFKTVESITSKKMQFEYVDRCREGDHICYISNLTKLRTDYPSWDITLPLDQIYLDLVKGHDHL